MTKRTVEFNGAQAEATVIEFEAEREPWTMYLLHDGTQLKIKAVLAEVLRVEGEFNAQGDPVYLIQAQPVVTVTAPDSLRRKV